MLGLDTSIGESFPEEEDISNVHSSTCMMSEGRGHTLILIALTALQVSAHVIISRVQSCLHIMRWKVDISALCCLYLTEARFQAFLPALL